MDSEVGVALRGDGETIEPGDGVVPILKEVYRGRLKLVGTGFYVTRYGLVATAKHVLEDLVAEDGQSIATSFVLHLGKDLKIYLRQLHRVHFLNDVDIGIAQADNYHEKCPANPLQNLRAKLSTETPPEGSALITYGYPENAELDFTTGTPPVISGKYTQGGFLRFVQEPEHPFLKFPYFETTVELRPGNSGGPVFDTRGRVIGVNSRSWDFRGSEHEGSHLSYIVPIANLLRLTIDPFMVPPTSWEAKQIPCDRLGGSLSGVELAKYGHFHFEPPVTP